MKPKTQASHVVGKRPPPRPQRQEALASSAARFDGVVAKRGRTAGGCEYVRLVFGSQRPEAGVIDADFLFLSGAAASRLARLSGFGVAPAVWFAAGWGSQRAFSATGSCFLDVRESACACSVLSHPISALVMRNSVACFAAGDNIVDIRAASRGAPGLEAAKVRILLCSVAAPSHARLLCPSPDTLALLYYRGERTVSKRVNVACCEISQSLTSHVAGHDYEI